MFSEYSHWNLGVIKQYMTYYYKQVGKQQPIIF